MLYYKYMTYKRFQESFLPGGVFLKVSSPDEFNDPYDCIGFAEGNMSRGCAEQYCNNFYIQGLGEHAIAAATAHFHRMLESRGLFRECIRVLSLSTSSLLKPNGDLLLWAHYADNSRGVRIGMDFEGYEKQPELMKYRDNAPVLNLDRIKVVDPTLDFGFRTFIKRCLKVKSKAWKYERESRLILPLNWRDLRLATASDSVKGPTARDYVLNLPLQMIREIAIGPACPDISIVQNRCYELKQGGYTNVQLKRCCVEKDFSLRYENLDILPSRR